MGANPASPRMVIMVKALRQDQGYVLDNYPEVRLNKRSSDDLSSLKTGGVA